MPEERAAKPGVGSWRLGGFGMGMEVQSWGRLSGQAGAVLLQLMLEQGAGAACLVMEGDSLGIGESLQFLWRLM